MYDIKKEERGITGIGMWKNRDYECMEDTAYDQDANVEANVEPELNELSESKRYIVAFC